MAHAKPLQSRTVDPLAVSVHAATHVSGLGRTALYEAMARASSRAAKSASAG